jgi:hypothetical protein
MKTNITYLILAVITTICISCESHNQPEEQHGFVTYTLTSTTTVKQSGTAPESSVATYERTSSKGQKGQMTAGNSTRLELRGWDDYIIKEVELQMRSNTSTGAGSLSLVIGNDTLWQIDNQPFSDKSWAGKYTTDWLPITRSMNTIVKENECIEINISATENSLYINSYTIYYDPPVVPQCYTVTFYTGLDTCPFTLTQSSLDAPIELPALQDTANWYFWGWTEVEVLDNQLTTPLLSAGDTYLPRKNMTLWSVYSNQRENKAVSEYISGQYAIAMYSEYTDREEKGILMDGYVQENGFISTQPVEMMRNHDGAYCIQSMLPKDVFYDVQFYEDSTVRIMHHDTKRMIGYKGKKLFTIDTLWQYRVLEEDGSLAIYYPYDDNYYPYDDNYYALYMGLQQNKIVAYSQPIDFAKWRSSGLWLFPKVEITTWPFGKLTMFP